MLEALTLHAEIDGKEILKGVNLIVEKGDIHVIMGPNGGGKSTFASVLAGHPDYKITKGTIAMDDEIISDKAPNERFQKGLFLSFQYPTEIAGVQLLPYLRQAMNTKQQHLGLKNINPLSVRDLIRTTGERLGFTDELYHRFLNQGFSGGEKKKLEILQMALLQPEYVVLDEPDSGLDVDALKLMAKEVLWQKKQKNFGLIIITHYARILQYIKPDFVHVMIDGKLVKRGDASLAKQIEKEGYEQFRPTN